MIITVPADLDGERLDRVIARVANISRSQAHALVEEGGVEVDGSVVRVPSSRVSAGASIAFEPRDPQPVLVAEPVDFEVVWEDDDLAIVDKPAGVVTHPGAGNAKATLAAGLLHRWPQIEGVGEEGRWGIVHRLDKGTSGLLLMAKTAKSYGKLKELVAVRQLDRRYLGLADGEVEAGTGTIEAPIERDPSQPVRRRVSPGGKPARTHYRRLASWDDSSLLELTLETGRTHQIRVHLAAIGHPIVGDATYGGPPSSLLRPWLHSWRLSFTHPLTAEKLEVEASLPSDLREALDELGEPRVGSLNAIGGGGRA